MRYTWVLALFILAAACGEQAVTNTPEPPPRRILPKEEPPPNQDEMEAARADNRQRDEAARAIENAHDADAARKARDLYKGTKHATSLDVALDRKLTELDFAAFSAARAAVQKTATPRAAVEAAKIYTGRRYAPDLEKVLWDHMDALVKKDPTLASQLPPRPGPNTDGTDREGFLARITAAKTESELARMVAERPGLLPAEELEYAVQKWRWSGAAVQREMPAMSHAPGTESVIWPEPDRLIVWRRDELVIFNPATSTVTRTIKSDREVALKPSLDGRCCMTIRRSAQTATILNLLSGAEACTVNVPDASGVFDVSPDGKWLALAGGVSRLFLCEMATGKVAHEIIVPESLFYVCFAPDGETVLGSSWQGKLHTWDVQTGRVTREFGGKTDTNRPVGWSTDGRTLLVVQKRDPGNECALLHLDQASGEIRLTGRIRRNDVPAVVVHPGGRVVLDREGSDYMIVWLPTGEVLHKFTEPAIQAASAFSPDGKQMAALNRQGKIIIFGRPE